MGVFEEEKQQQSDTGMHWHHHPYSGPVYEPSSRARLSPNLPPGDDNDNRTEKKFQSLPPFDLHIPKIEPEPTPATPPTPTPTSCQESGVTTCAGCHLPILDRYYLQAVERCWHVACLQCCHCRNPLDGDITCFSRQGNIYCKKDYYRLFGTALRRCHRCQAVIDPAELVMRVQNLVFHLPCFRCQFCRLPLTKGDQFGIRGGAVLCRLHFHAAAIPHPETGPLLPHFQAEEKNEVYPALPCQGFGDFGRVAAAGSGAPSFFEEAVRAPPPPPPLPRQKGRPRKRKPKDFDRITDLNQDYLDTSTLIGRASSACSTSVANQQRAKRMRTSFKHHQLRTMKSYFAVNHNPDAKDLKQLSQKTGLPKRVLQVWFQNARAKWRRLMLKQEGKSEKCSSDSLSDLEAFGGGNGGGGGLPPPTTPPLCS